METGRLKKIYHLPACIAEFVSEYIFLISENKQTSKIKKHKKYKKSKINQRRKQNIFGKLIKKNEFPVARVKIFLVTRISGNKSVSFWPWGCSELRTLKMYNITYLEQPSAFITKKSVLRTVVGRVNQRRFCQNEGK